MAKVREIQVKNVGNVYTAFVYRGFYCIKGGERAFHTPNVLRNNSNVDNVVDDDEFNMAHGRFDTQSSSKRQLTSISSISRNRLVPLEGISG